MGSLLLKVFGIACLPSDSFQQWDCTLFGFFKKTSWKLFFFFRKYRNFFTNWKENLTAFKRHLVRHFRKASTRLSLSEKRRKIHLLSEVSITKFCTEQKSLILMLWIFHLIEPILQRNRVEKTVLLYDHYVNNGVLAQKDNKHSFFAQSWKKLKLSCWVTGEWKMGSIHTYEKERPCLKCH